MKRLDGEIALELGRLGSGQRTGQRTGPGSRASGDGLEAIVRVWPAAVGPENARRAWPARFGRDGVLVVHASDSVWAFQLGMLASPILEQLTAALGEAAPTKVRFVPGPIPGRPADPTREPSSQAPPVVPEDAAKGAAIAAAIEDADLRESVARAAAASLARGRSDRAF